MPADLPPGALEEMERLLAAWDAAEPGEASARAHGRIENRLFGFSDPGWMPLRNILALAREALTLRERVAGLTASLDACQAGHTQQAKRAEAAEAKLLEQSRAAGEVIQMLRHRDEAAQQDAARLRAALEMTRGWLAALAYALDLDEDDTRIRVLVGGPDGSDHEAMAKSLREILDGAAAALRPAAPDPSCQGSLDNCGPTETETKEQSHG